LGVVNLIELARSIGTALDLLRTSFQWRKMASSSVVPPAAAIAKWNPPLFGV